MWRIVWQNKYRLNNHTIMGRIQCMLHDYPWIETKNPDWNSWYTIPPAYMQVFHWTVQIYTRQHHSVYWSLSFFLFTDRIVTARHNIWLSMSRAWGSCERYIGPWYTNGHRASMAVQCWSSVPFVMVDNDNNLKGCNISWYLQLHCSIYVHICSSMSFS